MRTEIIDFARYSSLRIGANLPVCLIQSQEDCLALDKHTIIGRANNLLVSPNATNLAMLDSAIFDNIRLEKDHILIGAATNSSRIFRFYKQHNLAGAEFLKGLPGSLGGIIKMNAGLRALTKMYEIKEQLLEVNINGEWLDSHKLHLAYRTSNICGVILQARLRVQKGFDETLAKEFSLIRAKHPKEPSCGSCFKNPANDFAGRLLESVGLKGFSIGGVGFSAQHANFLVNLGNGSFEDALKLIQLAKSRVYEKFKKVLEPEVQIIG